MNNYYSELAKKLYERRIKYIFGISGSGPSYKLLTELRNLGVNYIPVSHEAIAPIAAGVFQYMTGHLSASITIKGPGFVNALAGISAAWFERYPLLSISEDYDDIPPYDRMHKRIDQLSMVLPVVNRLSSLAQLDILDDFLTFSLTNPAPHHFELAEVNTFPFHEEKPVQQNVAQKNEIENLKSKIRKAKNPLLIVGSLIHRLGISEILKELKLPIFTTVQAKGVIDESRLNSAGVYTGSGRGIVPETKLIDEADLVLTIGLRNYELLNVNRKSEFINLDTDFFSESPDTILIPPETIRLVVEALKSKNNWAEETLKYCWKNFDDFIEESGWMPTAAFHILNQQDYFHGLVLDTGTFCTIGEHIWRARAGRKFIGSSNGRNMGTGIPSALGFSLAFPEIPIFCVMGDGGIRYYNTEVRTFVERKLPVCFMLMTDDGFGSIAQSLSDFKYADDILKPANRLWTRSFDAMGVPAFKIQNEKELQECLNNWDKASTIFLELPFDQEKYRTIAKIFR